MKTVEKEFNVAFSHENYIAIYYKNVNTYLAITPTGTKEKGSTFLTKPPVGNSNDFLAIPKALKEHLVNKTPLEEMFSEKNWTKYFTIFDFCASFKIAKKYTVIHNGKVQQQLNRFYVSKKGAYLYKLKKGKQNQENVLKGWGVELLNRYDSSVTDYSIDFRFYISKTRKILEELETKQTNLLSDFFGEPHN